MRIGVFGGSFDPIHFGHLLLAEYCREHCRLDQVWFVPAYISPHKTDDGPADAKHRIEMLNLATGGNGAFFVSDIEIQRGGVSYTIDTLAAIRDLQPDAELFFLMGADSLQDFPKWRNPEGICRLASLLVVGRPESQTPDFRDLARFLDAKQMAALKTNYVQMPLVDFSSTMIRQRRKHGKSIRYQTPRAVEKYLQHHRLYLT